MKAGRLAGTTDSLIGMGGGGLEVDGEGEGTAGMRVSPLGWATSGEWESRQDERVQASRSGQATASKRPRVVNMEEQERERYNLSRYCTLASIDSRSILLHCPTALR
jgi:hypothetical protein